MTVRWYLVGAGRDVSGLRDSGDSFRTGHDLYDRAGAGVDGRWVDEVPDLPGVLGLCGIDLLIAESNA